MSKSVEKRAAQSESTMQAVITTGYGSPEVFKPGRAPKPSPSPDEILVRIHASPVTKADTMMRTGKPYIGRLFLGLTKPKHLIWGTGFAGVVESVGANVTKFNPGDRVFGENVNHFGTYAEYVSIPEDGIVAHMPESLAFTEAAGMCDGGVTSLNFLCNLGKIRAGQHVLINGASGSLGAAAVQLAKHFGARVTAVCSTANVALVKALGADEVIDYTRQDFTAQENRYDLIYDTVGARSFQECKKALTPKGSYISPVLGMSLLIDMLATSLFGNKKAKFSATGALPKAEIKRLLALLINIVEAGHLRMPIDRTYPLEQIVEAHTYIDTGRKKGNVVLTPAGGV